MNLLLLIILFTSLGSLVSLAGGILLLTRRNQSPRVIHGLAGFAAGILLATAFFDLLPEAIEEGGDVHQMMLWVVGGILVFFLVERFLHWFHHHRFAHKHGEHSKRPTVPLIMTGDSLHNFIDGVVIAVTFMTDVRLGIFTTIAVAAHEIPQEIGDFGLLLRKGVSRKKVLIFNLFSALVAVGGAVFMYFIGNVVEVFVPALLSITAGLFIYISLSDIIPEIHDENERGFALLETSLLVLGVGVIFIALQFFGHSH